MSPICERFAAFENGTLALGDSLNHNTAAARQTRGVAQLLGVGSDDEYVPRGVFTLV